MNDKLVALMVVEALLKAAMEAHAVVTRMNAEGRDTFTDEERAAMRSNTDAVEQLARDTISKL